MENTEIIKITDSANSSKVQVMVNVPNHQFGGSRLTIAQNKAFKQQNIDFAKRYFIHKKYQSQEFQDSLVRIEELLSNKRISKKRYKFIIALSKSKTNSFMDAIQQAVISSSGVSRYKKSNYQKRQGNRTKAIWEIVKNNFNATNTTYATLTFNPDLMDATNLDLVLKSFRNFIIRFNKKYDNLKYIATYARQKNGNWHFHILINIPNISESDLKEIWKNGIVKKDKLSKNDDVNNVTTYLINNMKDNEDELMGHKGYLYSKNLKRSTVLKSWKPEQVDECLNRFEKLSSYQNKFISYDIEKPTGAIVRFEYTDGKEQDVFMSNKEMFETLEGLKILQNVNSNFTSVTIYHNENINNFIVATPKIVITSK